MTDDMLKALQHELTQVTASRDYWRSRALALECDRRSALVPRKPSAFLDTLLDWCRLWRFARDNPGNILVRCELERGRGGARR